MSVTVRCLLRSGPRLRLDELVATLKDILNSVGFTDYDLGLMVTNDRRMAGYNRDLLGKRGPTDVISVPNLEFLRPKVLVDPKTVQRGEKDLGDIVLSLPYVLRKAEEESVVPSQHLTFLLVHSVLHLVGYEHEADHDWQLMVQEEKRVMASISQRKLLD